MDNNPLFTALQDRRVFILYRLIPRPNGKADKVPVHPMTGAGPPSEPDKNGISAQDPANWMTPAEAQLWAAQWGEGYGVGVVISKGSGLFCIDLDSCREGSGWQPHAANFVGRFPGAYVETSVSGNGLHIIGSYNGEPSPHCTRNKTYRAELYTAARFIAVAGIGAAGSPLADCTAQLATFSAQFFPPHGDIEHGTEWTDKPVPQWAGPEDDAQLIDRALRSQSAGAVFGGRASFADLWRANPDALARSFPPQSAHQTWDGSAADQALANHLSFWTGNNCERMRRLMFESALRRDKWERQDYVRSTILRACGDQREWYNDRIVAHTPEPESKDGQPYQPVPQAPQSGQGVPLPPSATVTLSLLPSTQVAHTLTFDSRNRYEATLTNLIFVLAKQELAALGFDTFRGQIMICPQGGQWRPLTDTDMIRIREALERKGFAPVGKDMMRDALQKVAEDNSYDSAITWLSGLKWDGVPRVESFLSAYCGAADDAYTRAVSRYIWTGLAARIFEPGCQLDMVVALQSGQGTRKSSGLQAMAPAPEFFTDGLDLHADNDNFRRLIKGKIVVEVAELAGISKADVDLVKRVITRRSEEWVEKYQTIAISYKRRCMIFASTNNEQFLPQDETGQRRWLPVEIIRLDDHRIAADREQLWAEGAERFRALLAQRAGGPITGGVDFEEAERLAIPRRGKHEVSDVWEPVIERWLNEPLPGPSGSVLLPPPGSRPFTATDVLAGALHMTAERMDRRAELRAGNVLRQLGYSKQRVRVDGEGNPVKRWMKTPPA